MKIRASCGALLAVVSIAAWAQDYPNIMPGDMVELAREKWQSGKTRDPEHDYRKRNRYFYERWDVQSGEWRSLPISDDTNYKIFQKNEGVFFLGERDAYGVEFEDFRPILWAPKEGGVYSGKFTLDWIWTILLPLADRSILLLGESFARPVVKHLRLAGKTLEEVDMPNIAGPTRYSYAAVALADGRAMVLGGNASDNFGAGPFLAETWILDPRSRTWSPGPSMLEARAGATATRLPDGSVLVAGGWTPRNDDSRKGEPSRGTERWQPGETAFTAGPALSGPVANHEAYWLGGIEGTTLLIANGFAGRRSPNTVVQAFDISRNEWRVVADNCPSGSTYANKNMGRFGTLIRGKEVLAWCTWEALFGKEPLRRLRLVGAPAVYVDEAQGYSFDRTGAIYAAGLGDGSLLIAAGYSGGSALNGTLTTAADRVDAKGRVASLPPLKNNRSDARAFALPCGGYLVTGGLAQADPKAWPLNLKPVPVYEWLPGGPDMATDRWREIPAWFDSGSVIGQDREGRLIVVDPENASVKRASLKTNAEGELAMSATDLAGLNRVRHKPASGDQPPISVRGLRDGRVIVAGGSLSARNIALLDEYSQDPEAEDSYIELGERGPARQYEIHDPATNEWRLSALAEGLGGRVAILDTGEVFMVTPGEAIGEQKADGSWPMSEDIWEISDADGHAWRRFSPVPDVMSSDARPFVIQGELMIAGKSKSGSYRDGTKRSLLQWFDSEAGRWVSLWEAPPGSSGGYAGRVIVRELHGKRMAIPVEGL